MDTYSSGEDLLIKTRKPYTITKQRERWTEEEHNKFLEALKLYGRAWQRIEEHIGSKTAVQIRSHAQKFFTKLEKEALVKGVPVAQALDIDIPPPRPKRKPSNPYPRKTCLGTPGLELIAKDGKCSPVPSSARKNVLDLEKEPSQEKAGDDESAGNDDGSQNENDCSEVLNLFKGTPCSTLLQSSNRNFRSTSVANRNSCTFREFASVRKAVHDDGTKDKLDSDMTDASQEKPLQNGKTNETDEPENFGGLSSNDMQATQSYPKHVPVHVLNASLGVKTRCVPLDLPSEETIPGDVQENHQSHHPPNPYFAYATATNTQHVDASSSSSLSPPYPIFDPFRSNQDNYQAYLQASSAFSSLIVSTLLQNPAAHAAASFAASFWPCANMEACISSDKGTLGRGVVFPSSSLSPPPPSMAAVAAATVAAATAWWAAHGLLPSCSSIPPLHNGFNCNPDASATVTPTTVSELTNLSGKKEKKLCSQNQQQQQLDTECYSEALQTQQQSALKLAPLLSSTPKQSEGAEQNEVVSVIADKEKPSTAAADPNKAKSVKQVDRSSCGSNTPSSSEVETDALEKNTLENAEEEEELKEQPDDGDNTTHSLCDSNNRRGGKIFSSTSDSWKEVSQEGRLAFRALFSREVLPQSFSPPKDIRNESKKFDKDEEVEYELGLDLNNSNMWGPNHQQTTGNHMDSSNGKVVQWVLGTGQGKLKARHTGFKPYVRCSVEAKESLCNQGEEKCPKRMRLDGEPST